MVVPAVQIEAEYSNRYEVRDNALQLIINLRATIQQPIPQVTSQVPKFIVIPRLLYYMQLYRCDIEGRACSPVSQGSVYRGEANWLVIPCSAIPCSREVELPIVLGKDLIDRLVRIVESGKRPAFQVVFSSDPYTVPVPHAIASVPLPNTNANVAAMLDLIIPAQPIKGNLRNMPQFIALSSDDVKNILNSVKYFERVKVEVEVKLPETTEGLPKPLVDAVNTLRNAQEYLRNLDLARAIEACRNALHDITYVPKEGSQDDSKEGGQKAKQGGERVVNAEVKEAILNRYEGDAREVYERVLQDIEKIIRKTLDIMNSFIHESGKVQFNPGINDATYLCRQVIEIINYLVELSRGR
jgi:hypothetical protein